MPDPHQLLPPGARRSIRTRGRPRTGPTSRAQSGEAPTTQMLKVWNSTYYVILMYGMPEHQHLMEYI